MSASWSGAWLALLQRVRAIVPALHTAQRKGDAGRLVVVGGSHMYAGAPFFAGAAALRTGADLVTVVCAEEAAVPLKCYSPDLMVLPALRTVRRVGAASESFLDEVTPWLSRASAAVIGPGLGRDEVTLGCVVQVCETLRQRNCPFVVDGDGLFLVSQRPALVQGYRHAILTPNAGEFQRLWQAVCPNEAEPPAYVPEHSGDGEFDWATSVPPERLPTLAASVLARRLGGVVVLQKGPVDVISDGQSGDVLAGAVGTFASWAHAGPEEGSLVVAAFAGALLTRCCAAEAFRLHGRGAVASDLVALVAPQMRWLETAHGPVAGGARL